MSVENRRIELNKKTQRVAFSYFMRKGCVPMKVMELLKATETLEALRKYSPNQPRVPAGNSDGGQWTSGGGGSGSGGSGSGGSTSSGDNSTSRSQGGRLTNKPTQGNTRKPSGSSVPSTQTTQKPKIPQQETNPKKPSGSRGTSATVNNPRKITIHAVDGSSETREGGSVAWRNNNPGNLVYGRFAERHGAIGKNGRFAVFPDKETGYEASASLLRSSSYSSLTIAEAITRRSPSNENNTLKLINDILKASGLNRTDKISSLTSQAFGNLLNAIHRFEGWIEGRVSRKPASRATR